MSGESFSDRLLRKLRLQEAWQREQVADRAARGKTPQIMRYLPPVGVAFGAGHQYGLRRLRIGLGVIICLFAAVGLQSVTDIAFLFWYVPLGVAWIAMPWVCRSVRLKQTQDHRSPVRD